MARSQVENLLCDICGTTTGVKSFTIVSEEGASVLDLCSGDAKPLMKFYRAGSTEPRKRLESGPRRTTGHAVIPVD